MRRVLSLVLVATTLACGTTSDDPNAPDGGGGGGGTDAGSTDTPGATLASGSFGQNGGELKVDSGTHEGAAVNVSWGAVTTETTFTISEGTEITSAGFKPVGPAVAFGPSGTTFEQPVQVTVPYAPDRLTAGKAAWELVVLHRDAAGRVTWLQQSYSDETAKTVTAMASGFSTFQAAEAQVDLTPVIDSFTATPNPVELGQPVTLSWATTNAQACGFVDGTLAAIPSGSRVITPDETTTYVLNCEGRGSAQASVTVVVNGSAPTTGTATKFGTISTEPEFSVPAADGSRWLGDVAGRPFTPTTGSAIAGPWVAHVAADGTVLAQLTVATGDFRPFGLAALADGGVVVGGHVNEPATIGGTTYDQWGAYFVKFSSSGAHVWTKHALQATLGYYGGNHLVAAPDGSLYLAAQATSAWTIGGTTYTPSGNADTMVVKFDAAGERQWVKLFGKRCHTFPGGLAADASGVVVTGAFTYEAQFGPFTLTTAEQRAVYTVKLTPSGDVSWARGSGKGTNAATNCGVSSSHQGTMVRLASDGSVFVAAEAGSLFHLDETRSEQGSTVPLSAHDVIVKYAADGTPQWLFRPSNASSGATTGSISYRDLAFLPDGRLVAAGNCTGSWSVAGADLWMGDDGCLVSLAADGTPRWARRIGGGVAAGMPDTWVFGVSATGSNVTVFGNTASSSIGLSKRLNEAFTPAFAGPGAFTLSLAL